MKYRSLTCSELTERQMQVAILVCKFRTNIQIARELGVTRITVADHLYRIFEALGLESRMQLIIWMLKKELITLDDIELPAKEEEVW